VLAAETTQYRSQRQKHLIVNGGGRECRKKGKTKRKYRPEKTAKRKSSPRGWTRKETNTGKVGGKTTGPTSIKVGSGKKKKKQQLKKKKGK